MDELFRYTESLKRVGLVDLTRLCLLVSQEEWDEICAELNTMRRFYGSTPTGGLQKLKVYNIEVRKR